MITEITKTDTITCVCNNSPDGLKEVAEYWSSNWREYEVSTIMQYDTRLMVTMRRK